MMTCPICGKVVSPLTYECDICGWKNKHEQEKMQNKKQNKKNITTVAGAGTTPSPTATNSNPIINNSAVGNTATGVVRDYAPSIRVYDYEAVCGSADDMAFPEYYEIPKDNTGTLKDQGSINACVACVIAQIAEELYRREYGDREEMSEGFIYGAFRNDNDVYSGMSVAKALDYWRKIGTVKKSDFDVLIEMPGIQDIIKSIPELKDIAANNKISGYAKISYALKDKRDKAIKKALMENNYGVIAVSDYAFGSSHCIQIVGWDDKNNTYIFKNSWGRVYGDEGYAAIPKDSINEVYAIMSEEIILPFSDVSPDHWAYKYIKNMYLSGMMSGTSDTTFEPDKSLTRAEAATLFYRLMEQIDDRFTVLNKVINEKI